MFRGVVQGKKKKKVGLQVQTWCQVRQDVLGRVGAEGALRVSTGLRGKAEKDGAAKGPFASPSLVGTAREVDETPSCRAKLFLDRF